MVRFWKPAVVGAFASALLLAAPRPAEAAVVTAGNGVGIALVSVVTVGEDSWVTVSGPSEFVVPLPDAALEPQLVASLRMVEEDTAPREYRVERPPLCDPAWSCSAERPPIEPRGPGMPVVAKTSEPKKAAPRKTSAVTPPPADGLGCIGGGTVVAEPLPEPVPRMRVVERVGVQRTLEEFLESAQAARPNVQVSTHVRTDVEALLPNVSRFAVIDAGGAVRFHVKGPFTWPCPTFEQGGPREIVMVVTVGEPTSGSVLFPRQLLQAEPPRLYLADRFAGDQPYRLANQLAAEGRPIQLERAMPVDPADKTQRLAKDLGLTDPALFGGVTLPRSYRLFRYRFRGTSELGLSRMPPAELPRPREIATGFVTVDDFTDELGSLQCPRKFGACYRPQLRGGEWVRRFAPPWSTGQTGGRIVEAPFSLATPVMRDPSPTPVFPAPSTSSASGVDAGAPSGASAPPPARERAPGRPPSEAPGAHGCACDTSASSTNASRFGSALSGLVLGALVLAFRRRLARR